MPPRFGDSPRAAGGERGIALVLVLWLLALLALLVVAFSGDARTQLRLARNQHEAAAARAIADAGIAFAVLGVFDPAPTAQWRADGREHALRYGGGALRVSLQDEGGKIDLNVAPTPLLDNLFRHLRIANADQLARAIASTRAARGSDDAERSQAPAATPAFAAIDELRRLPGVDRPTYDRIAPFVTVFSGSPQFDPMTAPRDVLLSLPDVKEDAIDQFMAERAATGAIASDFVIAASHSDLTAAAPLRVFTVRSVAETANGARFVREAVVMLTAQGEMPYRLLEWRSFASDDGIPLDR